MFGRKLIFLVSFSGISTFWYAYVTSPNLFLTQEHIYNDGLISNGVSSQRNRIQCNLLFRAKTKNFVAVAPSIFGWFQITYYRASDKKSYKKMLSMSLAISYKVYVEFACH